MSGTIPLSMTQQMDQYGDPLSGGKLYFIVAGTVSTPQNAFQDIGLLLPWPNPITLDATGRVPQLFFADGLIKVRLTDQFGVTQLVADNLQVIGPSSGSGGGGGGASIDPTTVYQTGDLKARYGIGVHTGWVRCNGNTIGSSTSSANEFADPAAQPLFQYLWGIDSNLVVSGGRGASALADWTANKNIATPDWAGRAIAGIDNMGAGYKNRLIDFQLLGTTGGVDRLALTSSQVPATPLNMNNISLGTIPVNSGSNIIQLGGPGGDNLSGGQFNHTPRDLSVTIPLFTPAGSVAGGGQTHSNVQPTNVCTIYIKL